MNFIFLLSTQSFFVSLVRGRLLSFSISLFLLFRAGIFLKQHLALVGSAVCKIYEIDEDNCVLIYSSMLRNNSKIAVTEKSFLKESENAKLYLLRI